MTLSLSRQRAALMIIDIQERLAAAMDDKVMAKVERNALILAKAAAHLEIPIVVSQQYPKGLGPTIPALEEALSAASPRRFDKLAFSACGADGFAAARAALGRRRDQWIVCGMETHVCVFQTVRDLVADADVQVISDAVASRSKSNWHTGLALAERCGATVSSTEAALFDLVERAGSDDFKVISRLVK